MGMTAIMIAAAVVGIVGILIGLLLGVASEKFKVEVNEKEVAVGDKIYVWEDYFLTKNKQGQEYYITTEGYRPMTVGEKYYLFLKENGEGIYESAFSITGCYQGKYAVKDLKKEDFTEIEFGEGGREAYVELLRDVKGNLEF